MAAVSAHAEIGTIDDVPAATLLLPYFEASDPNTGFGTIDTEIAIHNVDPAQRLVQVVFWTDYAIPTVAFTLQMTSFSTHRFSVQDVFFGTYLSDIGQTADLPEALAAHTGQELPGSGGECAGRNFGDGILRGYVTMDSVNQQTSLRPADSGYFGGSGVATNDNFMQGDYWFVDEANNFSYSDNLVAIEASSTDPLVTTSGNYTFYGRYVNSDASDNREALGAEWSVPFKLAETDGNSFVYWRDTRSANTSPFSCFNPPIPLTLSQLTVLDENGTFQNPPEGVTTMPLACGRVLDGFDFEIEADLGWLFLDTGHNVSSSLPAGVAQSFVYSTYSSAGRFTTNRNGTMLKNATGP